MKVRVTEIDKGSTQAFQNGPLFTDKGSLTNGHWLIKKEFIPKNLLKRAVTENDPPVPPETRLWENVDEAIPSKLLLGQSNKGYYIFTFDGGQKQEEVYFTKKYIDFFEKYIDHFNLKVTDNSSIAFIYSGEVLAGLLMPYRP